MTGSQDRPAAKPDHRPGRGRIYESITDTIGDTPLVRLRSWRVEPVAGGVRLTGEAVAAWQ